MFKAKQKQIAAAKQTARKPPTTEETDVLKVKKAWEVALAPVKQLPMTAFMMYMSGNGLQIFSIMMVFMAFKNPIVGLMATNQAFTRFESEGTKSQLLMVKAVYVGMQILALALGIWKVNGMGESTSIPANTLMADFPCRTTTVSLFFSRVSLCGAC